MRKIVFEITQAAMDMAIGIIHHGIVIDPRPGVMIGTEIVAHRCALIHDEADIADLTVEAEEAIADHPLVEGEGHFEDRVVHVDCPDTNHPIYTQHILEEFTLCATETHFFYCSAIQIYRIFPHEKNSEIQYMIAN